MRGDDGSMIRPLHLRITCDYLNPEGHHPMTTAERLRTLARDLAGEAWDYDRRRLAAQAYVRREAAIAVMNRADIIEHEDAIFEEPGEAED